jgi:hypothetical protein
MTDLDEVNEHKESEAGADPGVKNLMTAGTAAHHLEGGAQPTEQALNSKDLFFKTIDYMQQFSRTRRHGERLLKRNLMGDDNDDSVDFGSAIEEFKRQNAEEIRNKSSESPEKSLPTTTRKLLQIFHNGKRRTISRTNAVVASIVLSAGRRLGTGCVHTLGRVILER